MVFVPAHECLVRASAPPPLGERSRKFKAVGTSGFACFRWADPRRARRIEVFGGHNIVRPCWVGVADAIQQEYA